MLAAAFCTVLLTMAIRGATLRQIQAGLFAISEQFDTLKQSLQGGQSPAEVKRRKNRAGGQSPTRLP